MGTMHEHPWTAIPLDIYERHMASDQVYQTQTINQATHDRLKRYEHDHILMLGVAGGNGLDRIEPAEVQTVHGVDVNEAYLAVCRERYPALQGKLQTLCMDLGNRSSWELLPPADLIIADLFIEYVGMTSFTSSLAWYREHLPPKSPVVLSCITQRNNGVGFVSESPETSTFDRLLEIHHDIDADELYCALESQGIERIENITYHMPNGKDLIRQDFRVK